MRDPCCMSKILLVGAGGLGGEFLYALVKSKYTIQILCIVDPDTVSIHTISRHALFNDRSCIGQSKAELAASFFLNGATNVEYYSKKIQDLPLSFFKKFDTAVCAVDNLDARRFVNCAVIQCKTVSVFIEGGSEGWLGHARLVQPFKSPCLECHIELYHREAKRPPSCTQDDDDENNEMVIVTAPFVNTIIAGIMLSLLYRKSPEYFIYNANTAYMDRVYLEKNPQCIACDSIKTP
jgi:ubiquitin-activating enzyme E1 C